MSFYAGQKVVCLDDQGFILPDSGPAPVKSGVYVIRELKYFGTILAVGLFDLRDDGYYRAARFRPLEELKREAAERQREEQPV